MSTSAIRIDPAIWDTWAANEDDEPSLEMRLRGTTDERAVREALIEISAAAERDDPDGAAGEWQYLRVPEGVMLRVEEPDDFEWSLNSLVRALERRGVAGTIELHEPAPVSPHPHTAPLLECAIKVRGGPSAELDGLWRPGRAALLAVLDEGVEWCCEGRGAPILEVGVLPAIRLASTEDPAARLRQLLDEPGSVRLWTMASEVLRLFAMSALIGRCTMVETFPSGDWRDAHAGLVAALRRVSDALAHAYVKRGSAVSPTYIGTSLEVDWPRRPPAQIEHRRSLPLQWEDRLAPDAFPVQLLGPGFAGRFPLSSSWRREPAGEAILVEHVDLEAWFDEAFVPPNPTRYQLIEGFPPPPVLSQARADLAAIVFDPSRDCRT